jgi:LysR family transcriptional regulator, hydrogen peroxide-inducible genes activator
MLVTLRQLQYVIAVAKTGSFTKAAEAENAEQSTVSHQIKTLEDRLGIEIFNREIKPIQPTKEGAELITKAHDIIAKVEALIEPFKSKPQL